MVRLHTGIIALCLLSTFAGSAYADIGTVRLLEDRLLFAAPAVSTGKPDQFVKVICTQDENGSTGTVTSDPIQPLMRVTAGETLTILDVIRCNDRKNGAYVGPAGAFEQKPTVWE